MGTSKLMGEKLMNAANLSALRDRQVFTTTRFGNVLGSRGSVMPLFREQIRKGGPVRLTDSDMTRFIMTLEEAVELLLRAGVMAKGGEVFITKMAAIRIVDLARVMIDTLAPAYGFDPAKIAIEVVGRRPGEKVFEELMNEEEVRRSIQLNDFFAVLPALQDIYKLSPADYGAEAEPVVKAYNSETAPLMPTDELAKYLTSVGLLHP
jgi:FlaA1/EpsC-like NDP-sugar epimerase